MLTSSAKAKGRRVLKEFREAILAAFTDRLAPGDICITSAGVPGPDLYFSPRARELFNCQVEGKVVERLNVFKAIEQAKRHCKSGETPWLVFRKNHAEAWVALPMTAFVEMLKKAKEEKEEYIL